jgi:enterochelin esterase-like enzyme
MAAWSVAALRGSTVLGSEQSSPPWNITNRPAPPGVEHHSFASKVVGKEVGYNVWLPPSYATSKAHYRVLYFLPGAGGNEYDCLSPVLQHVTAAVEKKTLPPVIVIFCNPGDGTFRNNRTPGVLGETMFISEFVPEIDRQFRTVASREGRAVMGFSMGGSGTLRFVLGHPELFCAGVSWGCGRLRDEEPAMSRLDQVKKAGTGVMLIVGEKEAPQVHPMTLEFTKRLTDEGVSFQLSTPAGMPHNIDLYLRATWGDAEKFLDRQLDYQPPR